MATQSRWVKVPVVRLLEVPEFAEEQLPEILREINERQWNAVLQVLIEAKYKAEAMLRNDEVMDSHGKVAFYQGWVSYSDYIIGSFNRLRTQQTPERERAREGPADSL